MIRPGGLLLVVPPSICGPSSVLSFMDGVAKKVHNYKLNLDVKTYFRMVTY